MHRDIKGRRLLSRRRIKRINTISVQRALTISETKLAIYRYLLSPFNALLSLLSTLSTLITINAIVKIYPAQVINRRTYFKIYLL